MRFRPMTLTKAIGVESKLLDSIEFLRMIARGIIYRPEIAESTRTSPNQIPDYPY